MVIFLLATVITILMTVASEKTMVFGRSKNGRFRRRYLLGERTYKLQKVEKPSPKAETSEMYIYAMSEKSLRYRTGGYLALPPCPSIVQDTSVPS